MKNKKVRIKNILNPADILPILMFIAGIVLSIFIDELAIKLIGISIAVLGIVVLLMKITTRLSSVVETKFNSNPPPNFKITVRQESNAKRQVIENFDESFESSTKFSEPIEENMGKDEGFRIIKKEPEASLTEKKNDTNSENNSKTEEENLTENVNDIIDTNEKFILKKSEELSFVGKTKSSPLESEKEKQRFKKGSIDLSSHSLMEEMPVLKDEPRKEFELFINRILMAIRSVSNTRTAAFFLYNNDSQELILDSIVSDSDYIITGRKKLQIQNDIISQIIKNTKPEILTEINPSAELDLLPYYQKPSNTQSFIGLPVIFDKKIIGVLIADSNISDAYDSVMVNFLGHFSKMISGLIRSYNDKYDLVQSSKELNAIDSFMSNSNFAQSNLEEIVNSLLNSILNLIETDFVGICMYNKENRIWEILKVINNENSLDLKNNIIDLENSIVGESIETKELIYCTEDEAKMRVNGDFQKPETYFFAIPLIADNIVLGSVFAQGDIKYNLSESEVKTIQKLVNYAAQSIEKLNLIVFFEKGLIMDLETGIYNKSAFLKELSKEAKRSIYENQPKCLCLIKYDKYESLDFEKLKVHSETLEKNLFNIISNNIKDTDIIGEYDDNTYGIILLFAALEEAKLKLEKIRNQVAQNTITINNRKYNLTISVGIAEIDGENLDESIKGAEKALKNSLIKTNSVSLFV